MTLHHRSLDIGTGLDDYMWGYTADDSSPVTIDSLSDEMEKVLAGGLSYWDFVNLGIGQVDTRFSRGLIARDPGHEMCALFVAYNKQLFRYTVSGNEQYGYSATYTDKLTDLTKAYNIDGAELAMFSYRRDAIKASPDQSELEAYLVALEKCGYEALRPNESPARHGWLSGAISLLK